MATLTDLSGEVIYGFTNALLLSRFDNPQPTPLFHIELWDLVTRPERFVAIAAPRGHAKSTAITHAYVLACVLFRVRNFGLIISDTEGQAVQFLGDIKREFIENDKLRELFKVKKFVKDSESDVILEFDDGEQFRLIAKGSEQKLRGIKWRNKRPNLIVGDDLENDEIVLNEERRAKFRKWFFEALVPSGSDDCIYRVVGTILHLDGLLERLMPPLDDEFTVNEGLKSWSEDKDRSWLAVRYKAHTDDFSQILWKEKFPRKRLEAIRRMYIEQGHPEGYAQEYLNYPIDVENAYFRQDDFIEMDEEDYDSPKEYYVGVDLAVSERDSRAYTAIVVAGIDSRGTLHVVDVDRFRGDSLQIISALFAMQVRWQPEMFVIEQENIARSIGPFLQREMYDTGIILNIEPIQATKDKISRARSIQARLRAGMIKFDAKASWYSTLFNEMVTFPKGKYVDQVDALAHIGLVLQKMHDAPTKSEIEDEEWEEEYGEYISLYGGRNAITGY